MSNPTWHNLAAFGENPASFLMLHALAYGSTASPPHRDGLLEQDPIVREMRRITGTGTPVAERKGGAAWTRS